MKLSRSLKFFLLGFLIVAVAIVSVSCSDDKKKSAVSARVRPGVGPVTGTEGCSSCSTSSLIATALGESLPGIQDRFQFGLDFFYVNDSQQIAAEGVLFLNNVSPMGQCYFTPGNYTVRTVDNQYGQRLQSQAITNLGLEATNGQHVIKMRVNYISLDGGTSSNLLDCNGDNYGSAMLGSIIVETVDGRICGVQGIYKTLDPVGKKGFNCQGY